MDEDEARGILGIAPGAPAPSWARAYLTAVRAARVGEQPVPPARLRAAYRALRRADVDRGGKLTASAEESDRFTLHGPLAAALPVLRRAARRVGAIDRVDETGADLLLVVPGAAGLVEVKATGQDELTAVRVTVPATPGSTGGGLLASDVVVRLVLVINERARHAGAAGEPDEVDEIVVGVFVETDDEDAYRDVAQHVDELAAFLGDGQAIGVG